MNRRECLRMLAFRALHEKIGVERIVNATVHGTDNSVVTDAIAQSGGAYKGIAIVNDEMSDKELESLDKAGIRGCRFAVKQFFRLRIQHRTHPLAANLNDPIRRARRFDRSRKRRS